ncbi:MAG: hypothetical protein M3O70_21555, partial [Actinomycetota bacterium]|nr:hypothetical protein [Actinomycetota bacterium]
MTPIERVTAALEARGCRPRRSGRGWNSLCPSHEADGSRRHNPSLSVSEGSDGRALVNCHAGCELEAVLAPLTLVAGDLFPPGPDRSRPQAGRAEDGPGFTGEELADYIEQAHQTLRSSSDLRVRWARGWMRARGVRNDEAIRYRLGYGIRSSNRRLDLLRGRLVF